MAYYYVKSAFGTATGDGGRYASQQSGTMASLGAAGVYGSIAEAIAATTNPVGDDFILKGLAQSVAENRYIADIPLEVPVMGHFNAFEALGVNSGKSQHMCGQVHVWIKSLTLFNEIYTLYLQIPDLERYLRVDLPFNPYKIGFAG